MNVMNHRSFGLGAAALIGLAGLAAGAAFAHPHLDGDGDKVRKVEKIIILEHEGGKDKDGKTRRFHIEKMGPGGHGKPGEPGARRFRVITPGGPGGPGGPEVHAMHMADCDGGETMVDESAGDDKRKTRVVFCGKGDGKTRAERLEKALERIASNEHIDAEHKARITASLREAIEKARAAD